MIGITLGDPAGIGPEIILKALSTRKRSKDILIFGSRKILEAAARDMHLVQQYRKIKSYIVDCVDNLPFHYGETTQKTATIALQSINSALQYNVDIIITLPIVKETMRSLIPGFIGHTEYLAQYFRVKNYAMVGLAKQKRIMLVTTHVPLRRLFRKITPSVIAEKTMLLDWGMKKYFGLTNPTIGVCALNPHAFEFSLGEDEKIKRGVAMAQRRGIHAEGPYPADSLFDRHFDGFLAMYHDQAMIYLKSKKHGLNFTMGLPIIRLSPLHGAALDIAGTKRADASGVISALREGITMYKNARNYEKNCDR
jgi:4-hydroxy-L-threonine phosphate dehydrogenase PdxA